MVLVMNSLESFSQDLLEQPQPQLGALPLFSAIELSIVAAASLFACLTSNGTTCLNPSFLMVLISRF